MRTIPRCHLCLVRYTGNPVTRNCLPQTVCGTINMFSGTDIPQFRRRRIEMKNTLSVLMFVLALLLAACAPAVPATPVPEESNVLSVFGAYATAIEEPWDGVIHSALQKAQSEGRITYEFTDDIGYAGDMERVLREVAEQKKPAIIFGDAFGNEEAVRRVAKDYPEIAFVFGSCVG